MTASSCGLRSRIFSRFQASSGLRVVGRAGGEDLHLLVQPMGAVLALELDLQMLVDVDQMRHVGQRIDELLFRQRAMPPVGEARRLVELRAGDLLHQLVVGDAVAEAADHGRDLRVEDRMRDQPAEMEDDLDVLPRGMEDLDDGLVGHQREERLQVDVGRQRIDQRGHAGRRHLDQAELRPEGGFADELGVDGDEFGFLQVRR